MVERHSLWTINKTTGPHGGNYHPITWPEYPMQTIKWFNFRKDLWTSMTNSLLSLQQNRYQKRFLDTKAQLSMIKLCPETASEDKPTTWTDCKKVYDMVPQVLDLDWITNRINHRRPRGNWIQIAWYSGVWWHPWETIERIDCRAIHEYVMVSSEVECP